MAGYHAASGSVAEDLFTETIERYVREGCLVPDLVVPMSEQHTLIYMTWRQTWNSY